MIVVSVKIQRLGRTARATHHLIHLIKDILRLCRETFGQALFYRRSFERPATHRFIQRFGRIDREHDRRNKNTEAARDGETASILHLGCEFSKVGAEITRLF